MSTNSPLGPLGPPLPPQQPQQPIRPQPLPQPQEVDFFDSALQRHRQSAQQASVPLTLEERKVRLRGTFRAALEFDPDLAARARRRAAEANVPEQLAYDDPEFATKVWQEQDLERRNLWDRNPAVARLLEDGNFARIASDDVDSLVRHDNVFRWIGRQVNSGLQQQKKGRVWQDILQAGGAATGEQQRVLLRLDDALARADEDKGSVGGFLNVVGQMVGTLPGQVTAAFVATETAAPFGPPTAAAAGVWAAMVSTFAQTAYNGMGTAYGSMRDMGLPHEAALKGSLASGLAEGFIEAWGVKFATAPLKGMVLDIAAKRASNSMTRQTAERALRRFTLDSLKSLAGNVGEELGQTISQHAAESWAIHSSGLSPEEMAKTEEGRQKLGEALGETLVDTVLAIGPLSVFFPGLRYIHDSRTARGAAKDRAGLQMLKDGKADALLAKRSLPDYMRMLAAQAKQSGSTHVHVDGRMLQEVLMQADAADLQAAADAAGVTVEQIRTMTGAEGKASRAFGEAMPEVSRQLADAVKRKTSVAIPIEEFIGHVADTPVGEALMQHVRFDPYGKTPAEAALWQREKETLFAASSAALRGAAAQEQAWNQQATAIHKEVVTGLQAASIPGQTTEGAREQADLIRAMVLVGAAEDKTTPEAWWAEHRFEILPALDPADAEAKILARAARAEAGATAEPEMAPQAEAADAPPPQTPGFAAQFAGSQIVEPDGQPMRLYRGHRAGGRTTGDGVRYYTDRAGALTYVRDNPDALLQEAYLVMRNPARAKDIVRVADEIGWTLLSEQHPAMYLEQQPELVAALQERGYDGATGEDRQNDDAGPLTSYVSFAPETRIVVADNPVPRAEPDQLRSEQPANMGQAASMEAGVAQHRMIVERQTRRTAKTQQLTPEQLQRLAAQASALGLDQERVLKLAEKHQKEHPQSNGWAPLVPKQVVVAMKDGVVALGKDGLPKFTIDYELQAYGFHRDQATDEPLGEQGKKREKQVNALARKLRDEVGKVARRAAEGDTNAIAILRQAGWYREMRKRLRHEFGGLGDLFADLLGATSPNTPVRQNWIYTVQVLGDAMRGQFDELFPQWLRWVEAIEAEEERLRGIFAGRLQASGASKTAFLKSEEWKAERQALTALRELPDTLAPLKANGLKYGFNGRHIVRAMIDMWRVVREGDEITGAGDQAPKALNFSGNLIGFRSRATIDVWAARLLQRMAGRDRIPSVAEDAVDGTMRPDGSTTGAFGFGQDVFGAAVKFILADPDLGANPALGNLGEDDLQAIVWFLEKEHWTRNDWTSADGEGGSFEAEADLEGQADRDEIGRLRRLAETGVSANEKERKAADRVLRAAAPKRARMMKRTRLLKAELKAIQKDLEQLLDSKPDSKRIPGREAAVVVARYRLEEWETSTAAERKSLESQIGKAQRVLDKPSPETLASIQRAALAELGLLERNVDRFVAGVSQQTQDYVPTDADQAQLIERLKAAIYRVADLARIVAGKVTGTLGKYAGSPERAIDLELIGREGMDVQTLWQELLAVGRDKKQDAVMLSRVLRSKEDVNLLHHRPGVEIYWRQTTAARQAEIEQVIRGLGQEYYTVIVDGRRTPGTIAGQDGQAVGVRIMFAPEFAERFGGGWAGLDKSGIMQAVAKERRKLRDLRDQIPQLVPEVTSAELRHYETRVSWSTEHGTQGSDDADGVAGGGSGLRDQPRWAGESIGEAVARATRHREASSQAQGVADGAAVGGDDAVDPTAEPEVQHQLAVDSAGDQFYSALRRGILSLAAKAASADGWMQAIRGIVAKGVAKQSEVEWSGVEDWLKAQEAGAKITRDDLLAWLQANSIHIEVRHQPPDMAVVEPLIAKAAALRDQVQTQRQVLADAIDRRIADLAKLLEDTNQRYARETDDRQAALLGDLVEDLERENEALTPWDGKIVGFGRTVVDELYASLLRISNWKKNAKVALQHAVDLEADIYLSGEQWDYLRLLPEFGDLYEQIKETCGAVIAVEVSNVDHGGHVNDPARGTNYTQMPMIVRGAKIEIPFSNTHAFVGVDNVVGWARADKRLTHDNRLAWRVQEIQSDWAQHGRKHGFAVGKAQALRALNEALDRRLKASDAVREATHRKVRLPLTGHDPVTSKPTKRSTEIGREIRSALGRLEQDLRVVESAGKVSKRDTHSLSHEIRFLLGREDQELARIWGRAAPAELMFPRHLLSESDYATVVRGISSGYLPSWLPQSEILRQGDALARFAQSMEGIDPRAFDGLVELWRAEIAAKEGEQAAQAAYQAFDQSVPVGPFVEQTDAWIELNIKKQLQVAANVGANYLSFATGRQNAELYTQGFVLKSWKIADVSPDGVREIELRSEMPGVSFRILVDAGGTVTSATSYGHPGLISTSNKWGGKNVARMLGEPLADAIVRNPSGISHLAADYALVNYFVGGNGMREFYDVLLPKAVARVAKKLGLTVTSVAHDFDGRLEQQVAVEVTPEAAGRVTELPLFSGEAAAGGEATPATPIARVAPSTPRGAFYRRARTIALFQTADLSTFLHESSHWYLTTLFARARKPGAAASVSQRAQAILQWMGVDSFESWDALTTEQKSALHERWSHSFELYLLAGRAPTPRLRRPFLDFRRWLRGVYQAGLDAQISRTYERDYGQPLPALTGEIRAVFDSMIASGEQIREAEAARQLVPMWATKEEALAAGWTEERWQTYEDEREAALEAAMARLSDKGIAEMEWMRGARNKILRDRQRTHDQVRKVMDGEVMAELAATPIYRALQWLRNGALTDQQGEPVPAPDGSHRLDREAIRRMFPDALGADPGRADEMMARMEKLGQLLSNDGVHPDAAAQLIGGFANGHELVRSLSEALSLEDAVKAESDRRMVAEHSELIGDDSAEEAISEALHDDARTRFVALELQALEEDLRRLSEAGDERLAARRAAAATDISQTRDELTKSQLMLQKLRERDETNPRVAELQVLRKAAQADVRTARARGDQAAETRAREAVAAADAEVMTLEGADVSQARAQVRALEGRIRQLDRIVSAPGATLEQLTSSAREAATQAVQQESWRSLAPHRHEADEARASRETQKALVAGDHIGALEAKRSQLLHHQLAAAATRARQNLEARVERSARVFRGKDEVVAKRREFELVAAARAMAGMIGIGTQNSYQRAVEQLRLAAKYSPSTWARIEAHLNEFAGTARDWRDMSVEQALDALDVIDSLWEQSAREKKVLLLGEQRQIDDVRQELSATMEALPTHALAGAGRQAALSWRQRILQGLSSIKALLRRVEHWTRSMDGGRAGAFDRYLWRSMREPLTAYRLQRNEYLKHYVDMLAELDGIDADTIDAPEIGYTFGAGHSGVGKAELLGALLHVGNASNFSKLLRGTGWGQRLEDGTMDTSRWDALLQRLTKEGVLTDKDWQWVQRVWDLTDRLRPQLQAAHREVFGMHFAEVQSQPFATPSGLELRGGYVPAKTDPMRVRRAQQFERLDELESDWRQSLPAVASGWRHSRVEGYAEFLNLDLRMVARHLDETVRFVHVQPAVRDVLRIWRSDAMQSQLESIDPRAWDEMVVPWLVRAARQVTSTPGASRDVDRFWVALRSRVGLDRMFLNISNAIQNVGGLFSALAEVDGSHLRASLASYMRNRRDFAAVVAKKSKFMELRLGNQMQALAETLDEIVLRPGAVKKLQRWSSRHGYIAQTSVQNCIDLVTWQGAYDQSVAEAAADQTEEQVETAAVAHADSIVRRTQHSLDPEDVARYEATTPFARTWLQFSGWFNSLANVNATAMGVLFREMGMGALKSPALWSQYVLGFAAPLIVGDAIAKGMAGRWSDDDDDGYLDEISETLVLSQLRGLFAAVPGVGQGLNAFTNAWNDQPYDDKLATSPVMSAMESVFVGVPRAIQALWSAEREVTGRNVRDVLTLVSLLTGIPVSAIGRPVGYLVDEGNGRAVPSGPVDYVRGLVTGAAGDRPTR